MGISDTNEIKLRNEGIFCTKEIRTKDCGHTW